MVDATQLWVAALGAVCAALAFIVFYAVRKVLILKEDIDKTKERLIEIESHQKETVELLRTTIGPEVTKVKEEQKELSSKLSADIRDINGTLLQIHTKVNDQELRVKSISTLVNSLSAQQQDSLRAGLLQAQSQKQQTSDKNGGQKGNLNAAASNNNPASPNKASARTSSPSSPTSPLNNTARSEASMMSEGATEMSAFLTSLLFQNDKTGNTTASSAIAMLARAAANGSPTTSSNAIAMSGYGSRRNVPQRPKTSTLLEILKSKNVPVSGDPGADRVFSATAASSFPPSSVAVYHLTSTAQRLTNTPSYRKKVMFLQFSVGPEMNETAIGLSNSGASGSALLPPQHNSSAVKRRSVINGGGSYRSLSGDHMASVEIPLLPMVTSGEGHHAHAANEFHGANNNAVLLFMKDIVSMSMSFEPLPLDESDSICFTIALKPTDRSTRNLQVEGSSNNNRSALVEVVLYASMCPTTEEWVAFLYTHLGERVTIKDDLL